MKNKTIICLSGYAKSGKDSLCKSLIDVLSQNDIKAKRFALADALKVEMAPFVLQKFGIDLNNCTPDEKEIIRPLMVSYGFSKRKLTNGKYFTEILKRQMDRSKFNVGVVTDVRYHQYKEDEVFWSKEVLGGHLVSVVIKDSVTGEEIRSEVPDEIQEIPKIRKESDLLFEWDKSNSLEYRGQKATELLRKLSIIK